MEPSILCQLLAKQIPPEQFQLWGTTVHWVNDAYDTPENQAVVSDVIANYATLAASYVPIVPDNPLVALINTLAKQGILPASTADTILKGTT